MAYITTANAAPFGAETVLRTVNFVTDLADKAVAAYQEYKTRQILAQLSPEQLEDIGLTR